MPARTSGGFELWAGCLPPGAEAGTRASCKYFEASSCYLYDRWTAEVAFALLSVMTRVANFLGTMLTTREVMDV